MIEVFFGLAPYLLIVAIIFYYINLRKILSQSPLELDHSIRSWFWLGLLPFVGIIFNIMMSVRISLHIKRLSEAYNIKCNAVVLMFLGIAASIFIGSFTLPLVGPGVSLLGAPVWIVFGLVVVRYRALFRNRTELSSIASIDNTGTDSSAGSKKQSVHKYLLHLPSNIIQPIRVNTFRVSMVLLAAAIASYIINDYRYEIWNNSGLWTEPTDTIQALDNERIFYRNVIFLMIPIVITCWYWSSEKKKIILFLRKFRQDDVNRALHFAIRKTLFRHYRLLTLDDAFSHPFPKTKKTRIVSITAIILASAVLLTTFGGVSVYLKQGLAGFAQAENLFKSSAVQLFLLPILAPETAMELLVKSILDPLELQNLYFQELEMFEIYRIGFVTVHYGFGIFLAFLATFYAIAMFRLRMIRRSYVRDTGGIEKYAKYVHRLKSWLYSPSIISPPASIVAVDTPVWHEAVLSLAETADIILFDLSDHTVNIEWEIEHMLAKHRSKCVFIAQRQRFREWTENYEQNENTKLVEIIEPIKNSNLIIYDKPENIKLFLLARALKSCFRVPEKQGQAKPTD